MRFHADNGYDASRCGGKNDNIAAVLFDPCVYPSHCIGPDYYKLLLVICKRTCLLWTMKWLKPKHSPIVYTKLLSNKHSTDMHSLTSGFRSVSPVLILYCLSCASCCPKFTPAGAEDRHLNEEMDVGEGGVATSDPTYMEVGAAEGKTFELKQNEAYGTHTVK